VPRGVGVCFVMPVKAGVTKRRLREGPKIWCPWGLAWPGHLRDAVLPGGGRFADDGGCGAIGGSSSGRRQGTPWMAGSHPTAFTHLERDSPGAGGEGKDWPISERNRHRVDV
jgi:hypothetical protein